ncbi:unnamed protein product [Ascophyllum nodosum]
MSQAEVFGHFRSFAVGLECNARALRRVLEEQTSGSGRKLTNGEFAAEYARALECATPETTAKELVAELAAQETSLRAIENEMGAQGPVDEVMEKYKALAEYNELAFVDLEERLSAYGYVRPATAADERPAVADSSMPGVFPSPSPDNGECSGQRDRILLDKRADLQAASNASAGNLGTTNHQGSGEDGNDVIAVAREEEDPASRRCGSNAEASEVAREELSGIAQSRRGGFEESFVATPVRPTAATFDDSEDDDDDSPATPKLADWEISEGTREALRLDQRARQGQGGGCDAGSAITSKAAPPRSLEALLAQSSIAATGANKPTEGVASAIGPAADVSNRFSVSSDWSPPHVHAPPGTGLRGGCGDEGDGREYPSTFPDGVGNPESGVSLDGAAAGTTASSPLGSDPPTPRMPSLEGIGGGLNSPAGWFSRDRGKNRNSSVETPRRLFTSPMKTPMGRSLLEDTLTGGKRSELTPSEDEGETPHTDGGHTRTPGTPPDLVPQRGRSQGGVHSPAEVRLLAEPADLTWGENHTADLSVISRRDSTGEQALSPGTPHTPQMLSPRHVDGTESAAAGEVAAPTTAANIIGGFSSDCTHSSSSSSSARGSGNEDRFCRSVQSDHDDADDDGCCQTPELPTLPRADVTAVEDDVVAADAALCRRRLEEADDKGKDDTASAATERFDGPLELVSEEEYARAPTFLTIQVSRELLNNAIRNLNAYAAPRVATASSSELLLTMDEIMAVIDQGRLSRTLLLSAAHLKRVEVKGSRMYRIRGALG